MARRAPAGNRPISVGRGCPPYACNSSLMATALTLALSRGERGGLERGGEVGNYFSPCSR